MDSITRRDLFRSTVACATAAAASCGTEKKEEGKAPLLLECKFIEKVIDGVRVKLRSYNGKGAERRDSY